MRLGWTLLVLASCKFDPSGSLLGGGADARGSSDGAMPPGPDAAIDAAPPDAIPIDAMPSCPPSYTASNGLSTYRFVQTPQKTWDQAEADCADDGAPYTSLVVIDDDAENTFVDGISSNRDVWIGADDQAVPDDWVDPFGVPLAFDAWGSGEPQNGDCGEFLDGAVWQALPCTDTLRYVCECDPTR